MMRVADLSFMPEPDAFSAGQPDPVFAAIAAVRAANARHIQTCEDLNADNSTEAERVCNAAGDAVDLADETLKQVRPATMAGLAALVAWYAEDAGRRDPGGCYLARLSALLQHPDPAGLKSGLEAQNFVRSQRDRCAIPPAPREGAWAAPELPSGMPGPADIEAAWYGLPVETQARIGIAVVDMVFQEFVYGDSCVVSEQPEDRPFPDDTPEHEAIRGAASEASNRRLNELTPLIEGALPHLFGAPGENPAWCPNSGPRP